VPFGHEVRLCWATLGSASESALRLTGQLSSGSDGARYAAYDHHGREVIVERLFLARGEPDRWRQLTARLELARQIRHHRVLPPLTYALSTRDPYVVKPSPPAKLATQLNGKPQPAETVVEALYQLADAVAAGHRLGLAHLGLFPSQIFVDENGMKIDFARTRCGGATTHPIDAACRPPSVVGHLPDDVFSLGVLGLSLLVGRPLSDPSAVEGLSDPMALALIPLLHDMVAPKAVSRPAMFEVLARLRHASPAPATSAGGTLEMSAAHDAPTEMPSELGRYRIEALIGEGSMGRVYRAVDPTTGARVALKVLLPQWSEPGTTLKRFYREAQVMAELDNPFIAHFHEVNQDRGMHYLAMEFVEGRSLMDWLEAEGIPPVHTALDVTRDVARALADVHDLGVIHRDVKPANILLRETEGMPPQVKLCDFGIALSNAPGDEKVTRVGLTVGTPQYMPPEQCFGAELDPAADVYALGITLYRMLAGRVPFDANDPAAVVYQHLNEDIPNIRGYNPDLDDEVVGLLDRMLVKDPALRIPDARALLEALERVQRGAPKSMDHHPRRPEGKSMRYPFQWQLQGKPAALWPFVSDTERLNRAIGLGAVDYDRELVDGVVRTRGRMRFNGVLVEWTEHAYEWIAPSRLGILREYSAGPFVWFRSTVELEPQGVGTLLTHTIEVEPRGVIGRAAAAMEIGFKAKKSLERVYRRIDRFVRTQAQPGDQAVIALPQTAGSGHDLVDAFEEAPELTPEQRARIDEAEERLLDEGLEPEVVRPLCRHVRRAAPQDVARIRPRVFARHRRLDHRAVLRTCLLGTRAGLLDMLWDIICPRCRIPADIASSLAVLRDAHHCEACALEFGLDFGESIEIVFRPTEAVRHSELGTYCIGGPGHTPHVVAQVQLASEERFATDLTLDEGSYLVVGRQMPSAWEFRVERDATLDTFEVPLAEGIPPGTTRALSPKGQRIVICNDTKRTVVARIERSSNRRDAVTAAEAASSATFRQLFPHEALAPGQMLAVQRLIVLTAGLADPWSGRGDEQQILSELSALHRAAEAQCEEEGGAVVKIHRDGVLATFTDPAAALRVAEKLIGSLDTPIVVASEMGSALATSINERLDYYGRVVHDVDRLLDMAGPGHLVMGETLATDPAATRWLDGRVGALVQTPSGVLGHAIALG